jgi:hypothetical protein
MHGPFPSGRKEKIDIGGPRINREEMGNEHVPLITK